MAIIKVEKRTIKQGLLTAIIAEILNRNTNYNTIKELLNNIIVQIESILSDKTKQKVFFDAINPETATGQRQVIFRGNESIGEQQDQQEQRRGQQLEVITETYNIKIPSSVKFKTDIKEDIELLRQNSPRFVNYYTQMIEILKNEDKTSLRLYGDMFTDVISRADIFQQKLQEPNQNYRTKKFMVNMALKTIFDADLTPSNKGKLDEIFINARELFIGFRQDNQQSHTEVINRKIDNSANVTILIKFYISIIKRIATYIEINSTNIKDYEFAVNQGITYLDSISFCLNLFGNLQERYVMVR
jgi:hypothetical protein